MLLPWLILLPLIGGVICWQSERFSKQLPRYFSLFLMGLTLFISILLWLKGNYILNNNSVLTKWQWIFSIPWIKSLGINISLAIDGLSILMIT
ncbi:MAG: NADH-quinone oxidoreductase subunit M, partial [Arsenophonus sp. ET-DL12-MAG3]